MSGLGSGLSALNRVLGIVEFIMGKNSAATDWFRAMVKKAQGNKDPVAASDDDEAATVALKKRLEKPDASQKR